jgi:hypothetical protein
LQSAMSKISDHTVFLLSKVTSIACQDL